MLAPNWEGPYLIKAMLRGGAYKLEDMEGYPVDNTWNADHLRKFYPYKFYQRLMSDDMHTPNSLCIF